MVTTTAIELARQQLIDPERSIQGKPCEEGEAGS